MTRFKSALLKELVTYAQLSAQPIDQVSSPRRRIARIASLAAVAATAAIAVLVAVPAVTQAAYAVEKHPDGTVTITFRRLGQTQEATRDLRAAGVPAQVVRLAHPGSCATTSGGTPLELSEGIPYSIDMPSGYPYEVPDWHKDSSHNALTIDPSAIPPGAVLFIIEHSEAHVDLGFTAGIVAAPAPTCWEAKRQSPPPPVGDMIPYPTGMPSPSPTA